ncbi:acyl-CoA dehydrogenase family protein [Achromobacter xylosoxidans]
MVNDWEVTQERFDLPADVWNYLKNQGFLGMIIPKSYGGLGFSAYAHSEIVTKLSTRSSALAVSVMVPNSLGPAELLLHYGTDAQKNHYLPRLARGEEVPAFALTSPWAGSDAAAIPDSGIVCKGEWQGREVVGMRVTWDKRYITLAPVCTCSAWRSACMTRTDCWATRRTWASPARWCRTTTPASTRAAATSR